MIDLNYVTRRGAIYVWRRRLPAWVSRTMYLQISLRTGCGGFPHCITVWFAQGPRK